MDQQNNSASSSTTKPQVSSNTISNTQRLVPIKDKKGDLQCKVSITDTTTYAEFTRAITIATAYKDQPIGFPESKMLYGSALIDEKSFEDARRTVLGYGGYAVTIVENEKYFNRTTAPIIYANTFSNSPAAQSQSSLGNTASISNLPKQNEASVDSTSTNSNTM